MVSKSTNEKLKQGIAVRFHGEEGMVSLRGENPSSVDTKRGVGHIIIPGLCLTLPKYCLSSTVWGKHNDFIIYFSLGLLLMLQTCFWAVVSVCLSDSAYFIDFSSRFEGRAIIQLEMR